MITSDFNSYMLKVPQNAYNMVSAKERKKLMFGNPYVINKKKFNQRELLLYANPLYGNKNTQKGAVMSCLYHALNYIRCRYKQAGHQYPIERHYEKIFSETRRALSVLSLCDVILLNLFDCWTKKNNFEQETVLHIVEWVEFFKRVRVDIATLNHENSHSLHSEACKHINNFIVILNSEWLSKKLSIAEMKEHLIMYFNAQQAIILQKTLTKDLKLNLDNLIIDFLKQRKVPLGSNLDLTKPLSVQNLGVLYALIPAIYMEQVARFNNLYFLTKDILKDVNIVLDAVEENGALVFIFPSKVLHNQKQHFIKNKHNFCIYDFEFSDDAMDHMSHSMVLVGGLIDAQSREFVYIINPNNTYTEQAKTPIYRIPYEKFKSNLLSYDGLAYEEFSEEKCYSLNRYFMYGANGLNRTRDPVSPQKSKNEQKEGFEADIELPTNKP